MYVVGIVIWVIGNVYWKPGTREGEWEKGGGGEEPKKEKIKKKVKRKEGVENGRMIFS